MSKWYKASELERLQTLAPRDGVNGLPDNHVITVSERTIRIDERELVQNNVSTDTYTLELDAEWDDITPVVIFSNSQGDYKVAYENAPTKIPAAVMAVIGAVDVSVFGLDSTGAVRVVTKAAPNTMDVVESGKFVGEVSEDDVSLLGQILAAVEAANEAAENANATIIKSAVATTLNPGEPATANLADNVLTLGIPKGEKGDKGNPGQDGVTPFTQATVTTLEPGVPATVSIGEDTLKLGIPKGEKGDKGDQGDKGETGDKGDPGTSATISVGSVKGLDAGASPTVVNSGTSTAARFDFGIPKGDKGDTGDPGHTPQRGVDYWTAEDVETVVEDAKARAVAEMAEIGNVPKGTVSGYVAHTEDAYAAKPLGVRIKGRTVKNLWPAVNTTQNGVTITTADDGLITVSGTPTSDAYGIAYISNVKPSSSVTMAISNSLLSGIRVILSTNKEGTTQGEVVSNTTQKTGTIPSDAEQIQCTIAIKNNAGALNASFRVMLVEGTEAPDCFTPPASITSVQPGNLVTSGKNLFPVGSDKGWYKGGYDASKAFIQRSNPVTLPYTSNGESGGVGNVFRVVAGQAYTLTVTGYPKNFSTGLCWALYERLEDTSNSRKAVKWNIGGGLDKTVTTDVLPVSGYLVVCVAGGWTDGSTHFGEYPEGMRIQCELGSTATDYEPPSITEVTLPETDPLMSINGKDDVLHIAQDGVVSVERHVERGDITEEALKLGLFYPAVDEGAPYFVCNLDITPYASSDDFAEDNANSTFSSYSSSSRYLFIGNNKIAPEGITRGVYRTWNSIVFWDKEFTGTEQAKQLILSGGGSIWAQVPESVEQLAPVTLPVLPAPTFNVYHDADVPSDTSVEYVRDINIALADLEAKIADLVTKEAANV